MTQVINVTVGVPAIRSVIIAPTISTTFTPAASVGTVDASEIRSVITSPTIATTFMVAGGVGPEGPTGPTGADSTVPGPIGPNGAAGVVAAVVAGTNITVNNTDPANPVVSSAAGSQWDDVVGGLSYAGGEVGIGTTTPSAKLDVKGSGSGTGKAFRVSNSASVPKLTVLDNGNVGVGGVTPTCALEVKASTYAGTIKFKQPNSTIPMSSATAGTGLVFQSYNGADTGAIYVTNGNTFTIESGGQKISFNSTGVILSKLVISEGGATYAPSLALDNSSGNESGFYRPATNNIGIVTGRTERIRINGDGNIGIGTTSPTEKLDVAGNVSANSLILKSPNGTKYTLAVADDGTLSTTAV